jgi:hypothetical protein
LDAGFTKLSLSLAINKPADIKITNLNILIFLCVCVREQAECQPLNAAFNCSPNLNIKLTHKSGLSINFNLCDCNFVRDPQTASTILSDNGFSF